MDEVLDVRKVKVQDRQMAVLHYLASCLHNLRENAYSPSRSEPKTKITKGTCRNNNNRNPGDPALERFNINISVFLSHILSSLFTFKIRTK